MLTELIVVSPCLLFVQSVIVDWALPQLSAKNYR